MYIAAVMKLPNTDTKIEWGMHRKTQISTTNSCQKLKGKSVDKGFFSKSATETIKYSLSKITQANPHLSPFTKNQIKL
jgi:hypothetical protein